MTGAYGVDSSVLGRSLETKMRDETERTRVLSSSRSEMVGSWAEPAKQQHSPAR